MAHRQAGDPPEHLVAYAVVVDPAQSAALLVDHRLAKRWLPSGGHVEQGEHPAASAHRELTEELGLTPTPHPAANGEPVLITRTKTAGLTAGHIDVSLWYAFVASVEDELRPDPDEFAAVRWWPINDVVNGPTIRFDPHLPRFLAKLDQLSMTMSTERKSQIPAGNVVSLIENEKPQRELTTGHSFGTISSKPAGRRLVSSWITTRRPDSVNRS